MKFDLHLNNLRKAIEAEDREQENRFSLTNKSGIKELKNNGVALYPLKITRHSFGYMDYPEITFRLPFPQDNSQIRSGMQIICFSENEKGIKGLLLDFDGIYGEFRLYASEIPDWMEDEPFGIRLTPDFRTSEIMLTAIEGIESDKSLNLIFTNFLDQNKKALEISNLPEIEFNNPQLNESQKNAVKNALATENLFIIHGPPGTGKTTTIVELILQYVAQQTKILVSAPSNSAVDHLAKQLIANKVNVLRVGNSTKVDAIVLPYTSEGKLKDNALAKEIKNLKIRAVEMRKMATQYKRKFGKDERDQRKLLFTEVKKIQQEIKDLQLYAEDKFFEESDVLVGTPIGLQQVKNRKDGSDENKYDILIIDEAGQCLEPLAYTIMPKAKKTVLAGDPYQLPPTVLSNEAKKLGLDISILERLIDANNPVSLLDTQYRMTSKISGFSNAYFYSGKLKNEKSKEGALVFIDTAGSDSVEDSKDGQSLKNETEAELIAKLVKAENLDPQQTKIISPYAGQVALLKEKLPKGFVVNTVDSFQGQEAENIVISLVRANDKCEIGFLKDYRRMNVALTRAKEKLFVIGNSTTIGADDFYNQFLEYAEKVGNYKSIWEYLYE